MLRFTVYGAVWCQGCIKMQHIIWSVLREFNHIEYRHIDIDTSEERDLFKETGSRTVPFYTLQKNDKMIWSGGGVMSKDYLRSVLARY